MASVFKEQIKLKQKASHVYTASSHRDWGTGPIMHGGCIGAVVHDVATTHLRTEPKLKAVDQPDVLSMHLEFLRPSELIDSVIKVTDIKIGSTTSSLQLLFLQKEKAKAIATVTSANFAKPIGPSAPTGWTLHPPTLPPPDFEKALAHQAVDDWIPFMVGGETAAMPNRQLHLMPRKGLLGSNLWDCWSAFTDDTMDGNALTWMADSTIVAMADIVLRTGSFMDAHHNHEIILDWANEHPGKPYRFAHTFKEAMQIPLFTSTVSMNIEYKRRLPTEGIKWIYTRAEGKVLEGGRFDMELILMDADEQILCTARHMVQATEPKRKFRDGGKAKASL